MGMNNIFSCLLHWLNYRGFYFQPCGKNHKMPQFGVLVDNCRGQKKKKVIIRFLNMIKEGGLLWDNFFCLYINVHTKNDFGRTFNSLKVLYWKENVFTFEKCCEILNTRDIIENLQMFHENFFDLESFLYDLYDRSHVF